MTEEIMVTPIMLVHLITGLAALLIGAIQIFVLPRGTRSHKITGRLWVSLMAVLAFTSLFDLLDNGWLSLPAHFFTLMILILLPLAVWAVRNGKITLHKYSMFCSCGILVFLFVALILGEDRLLHIWLFGQ